MPQGGTRSRELGHLVVVFSKPNCLAKRLLNSVESGPQGSREIDLEEADPDREDPGTSLAGVRLNSSSHVGPEFKGVSHRDSVRLSEFARHDFAIVCHLVAVLCGPEIDVGGQLPKQWLGLRNDWGPANRSMH